MSSVPVSGRRQTGPRLVVASLVVLSIGGCGPSDPGVSGEGPDEGEAPGASLARPRPKAAGPGTAARRDADATTPLVYLTTDRDGPPPLEPPVLSPSSPIAWLVLETGPAVSAPDEVVCVDGAGHEVCAAQLTLSSRGEAVIDGVVGEQGVRHHAAADGTVALSLLAASEGLSGRRVIARVHLGRFGPGAVELRRTSRAVDAASRLVSVRTVDPRRRLAIVGGDR